MHNLYDNITELQIRADEFFKRIAFHYPHFMDKLGYLQATGRRVFCFGGVLRDLVLYGTTVNPRDIDIVVDGEITSDELVILFFDYFVQKTRFGGVRININGLKVDIWPVKNTWALCNYPQFKNGLESLPFTTFLNIEAILFEIFGSTYNRLIFSNNFFESLQNKTLEINFEPNPYPSLCIVRSIILAKKINFTFGANLLRYIKRYYFQYTIEDFISIQKSHYDEVLLPLEFLQINIPQMLS